MLGFVELMQPDTDDDFAKLRQLGEMTTSAFREVRQAHQEESEARNNVLKMYGRSSVRRTFIDRCRDILSRIKKRK